MIKKRHKNEEFSEKVLRIYSGSDITLGILLNSMNVYYDNPLSYDASVIVELRRRANEYIVTVSKIQIFTFVRLD